MMRLCIALALALCVALPLLSNAAQAQQSAGATPYAQWANGPGADPHFFPIAVWLQSPSNAARYKAAGINLYIGLWGGPTEEQLTQLRAAGMPVICAQNEVGLKHINDKLIVAWMHGDEPDNAQSMEKTWKNDLAAVKRAWPDVRDMSLEQWKSSFGGFGPPIPPQWIIRDYKEIKSKDPSRPVLLNLGQGVAYEGYGGRGTRSGHMEDYPEYAKGCDIVSYDIYPVTHNKPEVKGNLYYVSRGVERLVKWTEGRKPVWNCIEASHISSDQLPTPHQIRAEVWMSIIHGSNGLIYFVHEWKPKFNEHALLDYPELLAGVTKINMQIQELAPVLNSPTVQNGAQVRSGNAQVPVATMVKKHGGATYLFAAGMRAGQTRAAFSVAGLAPTATAEVLGENRKIAVRNGSFMDNFGPYDVHLYRIR